MKKFTIIVFALVLIVATNINVFSSNNKNKIASLIIMLEKSISPDYMSSKWKERVSNWKNNITNSNVTLAQLGKAILILDKHIVMGAFSNKYQRNVSDWPLYLSMAKGLYGIKKALLSISGNLVKNSRTAYWFKNKSIWLKKIKALR